MSPQASDIAVTALIVVAMFAATAIATLALNLCSILILKALGRPATKSFWSFTLTELLFMIAVIGFVVGLLLPSPRPIP